VSSWYDDKVPVAYLLGFLACFFLIAGANRILTTRLMVLPTAPVAIESRANGADLVLKSGDVVKLRLDLKLFREKSGRTFGLTGINDMGKRCQYVFHRGQFKDDSEFKAVMDALERGQAGKA